MAFFITFSLSLGQRPIISLLGRPLLRDGFVVMAGFKAASLSLGGGLAIGASEMS